MHKARKTYFVKLVPDCKRLQTFIRTYKRLKTDILLKNNYLTTKNTILLKVHIHIRYRKF